MRFLAFVLALSVFAPHGHSASGTVMPSPIFVGFDDNGVIVPGGKLYTYAAGTSTPLTTYSDVSLTTPNANPVVLSAAGRATVFLTPGLAYKFLLATSADVTLWTQDNISAVPFGTTDLDITGTAGESLSAGDSVYLSDGTGGCGASAGRWYKADADLTCASTTAQALGFAVAAISSAASGSIRIQGKVTGLAGLASGTVYYVSTTAGAITSSAPTNSRPVGVADSGTTLVISSGLTPVAATGSVAGIVSLTTQTLGAGDKTFSGAVTVTGQLNASAALVVTGKTTTGIGGGSASGKVGGTVNTNVTPVGNVGAGEDSLMSYQVPAATLDGTNANMVCAMGGGTLANDTANVRIRVKFGATTMLDLSNTSGAASANDRWNFEVCVMRLTATTQSVRGQIYTRRNGVEASDRDAMAAGAPAETLANAITILVTGEATNTNQIVQTWMSTSVQ